MTTIPFIDIFAGPGGLSEGSLQPSGLGASYARFENRLAIDKDPVAAPTLRLRSFFRLFPRGNAPDEYYEVARGQRSTDSLAFFPQWEAARRHVWNVTLGEVDHALLHHRIDDALSGCRNWVLLGGPPWQLVRDHGDQAKLLLLPPADTLFPLRRHGEVLEQLGGRQSVLRSQSLIGEVNRLYADPKTGRPKKGVAGSGRGSVRRLALVLRQLDLTYDVERLPEGKLLSILPQEFDRWRAKELV